MKNELLNLVKDLKRSERGQRIDERLAKDPLQAQNTFLGNTGNLRCMREKRKLFAAGVRSDPLFRPGQV